MGEGVEEQVSRGHGQDIEGQRWDQHVPAPTGATERQGHPWALEPLIRGSQNHLRSLQNAGHCPTPNPRGYEQA